jgi:dolichol-phosphate mannosyltransferase
MIRKRLAVIIPCCNEQDVVALLPERLFPVLSRLEQRYATELVLIDDGSTDDTWLELQSLAGDRDSPVPILLGRHPRNRGLGAGLRTGLGMVDSDIVVTADVDGTYPFAVIEALVDALKQGADVATASPYHPDGAVAGVSAWRLLLSRGASMLYRVMVDRHVHTYTALVRAYRAEVFQAALSSHPGFLNVAMTLVEARRRGARITDVPAVLAQREVGQSKARVARIARSHLRYMTHLFRLRVTGKFWIEAHPAGRLAQTKAG